MKIIRQETKLCLVCMEEHEVQTICMTDIESFKQEKVSFKAIYEYCDKADEFLETENMIKENSLSMKDAYRNNVGLLTSNDIIAIRNKYKVSQKDFSEILDWGRVTITRYENHQVQDRAHDDVLRKIDSDPKWFLEMLIRAKGEIPKKAFDKYNKAASEQFKSLRNQYLMDSIHSIYATYSDDFITGGVKLNLHKIVEIINYYALNVKSLHKVKLMKLLWYADNLSYKRTQKSITGLVYCALPMGAVPVGYEQLLGLEGIHFEAISYNSDHLAFKFYPTDDFQLKEITSSEADILDTVIKEVGHLNSKEIINKMHNEDAYKQTKKNDIIHFSHSKKLTIQ